MFKRAAILLFGAALFGTLPASGDQWNKKTVLNFSNPIEIPGMVLPAGEYVFKLLDSPSNRNIVQVFNGEENHVYATILAIAHYRMQPTDKTVILFAERNVDQPQAIHAWFYPGEVYGQEFVYPKSRATQLAQQVSRPVLAAEIRPEETIQELEHTPVVVLTPDSRETPIEEARVETTSEPEPTLPVETRVAERQLPQTSTWIPAVALLGVGSLAAAAFVNRLRRRRR
jgi:hypothetical protein